MADLFLIAHKVRGLPAFDIATQMPCPMCAIDEQDAECVECDSLGFWWIIPTSGHRAYPWWHVRLADINDRYELQFGYSKDLGESEYWPGEMPLDLPDHYPSRATPTISLAEVLGLTKPKPPSAPIIRRF